VTPQPPPPPPDRELLRDLERDQLGRLERDLERLPGRT
jgi:hypothetical protein